MPTTLELLQTGVTAHRAGDLAKARESYRRVLKSEPRNADALNLLGILTVQMGDHRAGEALIRRALAARPNTPSYLNNLGKALAEQGRWTDAIDAHRRAVELAPDYGDGYYNLGVALHAADDAREAERAYRRAAELSPHDLRPLSNLGAVLKQGGRYDEAVPVLRAVLARDPRQAEALTNLAYIQMTAGEHAEARKMYCAAIAAQPQTPAPFRSYLTALLYDPSLDLETIFAEHLRFATAFRVTRNNEKAFANRPDPTRPLRIGWLSADMHAHSVARNLEPLIERRADFEHFFYAEPDGPNEIQSRLKVLATGWRPTARLTDAQVAEQIRADRIDILMIVAGRFDRNRPLVATFRPAPIQISLFDAATSGLSEMDYFIGDSIMIPPRGQRRERFTERPLRLPNFYTHVALPEVPVAELPALRAGTVTFGCFNNPAKVNGNVLDLWAEVLKRVPKSRLLLKYLGLYSQQTVQARVLRALESRGIDPQRIAMTGATEGLTSHLEAYAAVDIALDPFPFNGSTSTFEALWMGVPVVSLLGDNFMARWTPSLLRKIGHPELIAADRKAYVDIAAGLAADTQRLTQLRSTLRHDVRVSALCDPARTSRYLARMLRAVWRRWCGATGLR